MNNEETVNEETVNDTTREETINEKFKQIERFTVDAVDKLFGLSSDYRRAKLVSFANGQDEYAFLLEEAIIQLDDACVNLIQFIQTNDRLRLLEHEINV